MVNIKKKTLVLVLIILFSSSMLWLVSASGNGSTTGSLISNKENNQSAANSQPGLELKSTSDSNLLSRPDDKSSPHELFLRMIFALFIVAALGFAAIFLSKKIFPRINNLPGKKIRITETVYLGPRRSVHLLEIGQKKFLIGCTNENINTLADLTDIRTEESKV
jgi:flagellar biosynthetic protein FliO